MSTATTLPRTHAPSLRVAFVAATTSLVVAFVASAAPLPLYNTYRAQDGLTTADLSLAVAAYFAGTIGALLCLGGLSTHLGRKPVALATLALVMAGCAVLLDVHSVTPLALGRFLTGLGCGMASSTLMAYVVDAAPEDPPWLATLVTSQAPNVGLVLGVFASATIVDHGSAARHATYLLMIALLAVCLLLVALAPETQERTPGVLASLRPSVHLPGGSRALMPVAACGFVATWALGGAYQSFGPAITRDYLHDGSALAMALVFSSYLAPGVLGAPLQARLSPATAQKLGTTGYLVGALGLLLALRGGSVLGFLVCGALAGLCQGVVMAASVRALLTGVGPADRAGVLAATYLTCYLGAMVPGLVTGQLTRFLSIPATMTGFVALAVIACAVTWRWARNPGA